MSKDSRRDEDDENAARGTDSRPVPPAAAPAPLEGGSPLLHAPPTPFAAADDEWESELAAWDAAIPIVSRAPVVSSSVASRPAEVSSDAGTTGAGAVPAEENPFPDTPTTVVGPAQLLDLEDVPDMFAAGTFDDGLAPASGSYAALVATDQSVPGIFDRDPPFEPPPALPTEMLREMSARAWTDDLASLIKLGKRGPSTSPARGHWETLGKILAEERAVAQDPTRAVALSLAGARVADELGNNAEARALVDAVFEIDGSSPAAHRARFILSERTGPIGDDAATESLARLAFTAHPDQPYYRSLYAEWTLSRVARGLSDDAAAAAVASLPQGLARLLGEAELAWNEPVAAAALIETAGQRVGGGLGAALLVCAAGLNERAQNFQAAAEQRLVAARLDEHRPSLGLGILRDLARLEAPAVIPALEDLLGRLPRSPLKVSLARWGASAAVRAGDAARAWRFVAGGPGLGPPTAALARDRVDLWSVAAAGRAAGRDPDVALTPRPQAGAAGQETLAEIMAPLWEVSASPVARLCVAVRMCQLAATDEDVAVALTSVEKAVAEVSNDAPVLAPAVERLARLTGDPRTRARALRLWRDLDAARWTAASLELIDTLASQSNSPAVSFSGDAREDSNPALTGRGDTVAVVLAEIAARDASSPAFWTVAVMAAQRGAFLEAAVALEHGLERPAWRASALSAPLAELASELTARVDLARAAARLAAARPKQDLAASPRLAEATAGLGLRLTRGRILRALGDRDLWAEYVKDEIVAGSADHGDLGDPSRRAALLLEPIFWRPERREEPSAAVPTERADEEDVPALVAAALNAVPLHPAALALALGAAPHPAILADRFAAGRSGPGGRRWLLGAAVTATVAGDPRRGLAFAIEARSAPPSERGGPGRHDMARAISATIRRLAWTAPHTEQRAGILRELADADGTADALVEAAEATESMAAAAGEADLRTEARRLFEAAAFASGDAAVAADVRLGIERLAAAQQETPASFVARDGSPGDRRRERDRVRLLEGATRAGRWEEVVTALVDAPPHEDQAGAEILALAAAIDEGRATGERAREIWACARAALAFENAASTEPTEAPSMVGNPGASSHSHRSPPRARPRELAALLRAGDRPDADPAEAGAALERLADAAMRVPDERSAALLLVEAAYLASTVDHGETTEAQQRCLQAAVRDDPASAPAAMAWRRWLLNAGRLDEAAHAWVAEAEALVAPPARVRAFVQAAVLLLNAGPESQAGGPDLVTADRRAARVNEAAICLNRALEIDPHDHAVFARLRELYEETHRHAALAALLATRLTVTSNPFEITALRLARADIFADALHDRAQAKLELEAILQKEPQHARALARLADLEQEEGNDARAADLLIRRAFVERSPEKLRDLFLRLGRIYTQRLPDPKRAVGAYARVLQLDANNREALDELSGLYAGIGETKSAISITERLVRLETIPETRARYHIRLGHLAERASDSRGAALHFRRAAEEAPRDLGALGEFIRHLDKIRDTAGRRAYLDRIASDLRVAVLTSPTDSSALQALIAVLRWRGRTAAAAAAAELLAMTRSEEPAAVTELERLAGGHPSTVPAWATPPVGGRRLAALAQPSVDEETFPSTVPPSVRHLFRLLAPVLAETGRLNLALHHLERGDRVAAGQPPRDVFDAVGAELAAGRFELYVAPSRTMGRPTPDSGASAVVLTVEPGKPPVIILGAALLALGPPAVRFAAGRSLRLISTHLDVALVGGPEDLGIWVGGVVRQFVTDYGHPLLPPDRLASRAARVAKLLPKRLRQEILPFAMESSGQLDLAALRAGILDGANRAGLLASGSLEAALRVVLLTTEHGDRGSAARRGPLEALVGNAEAEALLAFALSDAYDDLVRALE